MNDVRPCSLFERHGALQMESGEPLDEHFSICPECLASRAKYERVTAALKLIMEKVPAREKPSRPCELADTRRDPSQPAPKSTSKPAEAAAQRRLCAGAMLDEKYRLSSLLKRSHTCAVWAARNTTTYRTVAVKILLDPTEERRRELMREVHAHGWLSHRNVIDVVDVGETAQGYPFLVMPLLTGETLAQRSRQGRLFILDVLQICRDVARAIAAAHAAGIGHGGLKQESVFLHQEEESEGPVVKVFGLSIQDVEADDDPAPEAREDSGRACALRIVPRFNSKESAARRADIVSLGIILLELLLGMSIPRGASPGYLRSLMDDELPGIVDVDKFLQSDLRAILARCFKEEEEEGAITASEIVAALQMNLAVSEPPPSRERPLPLPSSRSETVINLSAYRAGVAQAMAQSRVESPAQTAELRVTTAKLGTTSYWGSLSFERQGSSIDGERPTGS